MKRPRMRDYLFHLEHVQLGQWSDRNCSVCKLANPSGGIKAQAEVTPGTPQLRIREHP